MLLCTEIIAAKVLSMVNNIGLRH